MLKTRIIPTLLISNDDLIKTIKFKKPNYIGDPLNAVKLFNELEVDELIFLDILATRNKKEINFNLIKDITSECFMPLGYGGGISSIEQINKLFYLGVEKVIINSAIFYDNEFIKHAVETYGSQSIVASIDVKKDIWGKDKIFTHGGTKKTSFDPVSIAIKLEQLGVGEIIVNSIDRDGTMSGYDINLISKISSKISIPLVAQGGAGNLNHFKKAINSGASAVAGGSFFIYHGNINGILLNYPEQNEIDLLFE